MIGVLIQPKPCDYTQIYGYSPKFFANKEWIDVDVFFFSSELGRPMTRQFWWVLLVYTPCLKQIWVSV